MRYTPSYATAFFAIVSAVSAQAVKGTAYGFATGVTGGGDATPAAPANAAELATWLADDTPRVILIDKLYDFTGTSATGAGCVRKNCAYDAAGGGQLYLGKLSCSSGDTSVSSVSSITYDAAGLEPLEVGPNKSIISSNGKGVIKGKGFSVLSGASNIIIQGIEFTTINEPVVWTGDALEFKGNNDGVWVDHCKFSTTGRMFIVNHFAASRLTISNNEFDGKSTHSSRCNGQHYWNMMFYGPGDQVTLHANNFHHCSGRAPKLGEDGASGTFHAVNNYFSNMDGHAFDAYDGATALIEGNVFEGVKTPITEQGASVATIHNVADRSAASACSASIGRVCELNTLASSGDWPALSSSRALTTLKAVKAYLLTPMAVDAVKQYVTANYGVANLATYTGFNGTDTSNSSPPPPSVPTHASSVPLHTSTVPSSPVPTVPSQASNIPSKASDVPSQASTIPSKASDVPSQASTIPSKAPDVPINSPTTAPNSTVPSYNSTVRLTVSSNMTVNGSSGTCQGGRRTKKTPSKMAIFNA